MKWLSKSFFKKIVLLLFDVYKVVLSPIVFVLLGRGCKYNVTCSEYTKREIKKLGVLKGLKKGAKRLATCHSFNLQYTN